MANVRRVNLDMGIGDASLSVDGNWRGRRRAMLVGAEVSWDQGRGECEMVVDLQAGDLRVDLADTLPAPKTVGQDTLKSN